MDNKQWSQVTLGGSWCSSPNTYKAINGFLLWMIKYPFPKLNLDFPFIILYQVGSTGAS